MENESTTRKCTVFLSPKSDIVFKAIFGNAKYVKILISLLKAVLNLPDEEYEEVSIVDPHLHRDRRDGKLGIVDVRIKTKSGKIINIEIQLRPKPDFLNRVIFYQSKMIAAQLKKGENFSAMHKVVSIIIADYDLFPGNEKYHRFFTMCEPGTGQRFADMQEIHTLELKKLPEEWDGTDLHAWLQFFNAKSKEELNMIAEAHPTTEIKQAVGRWAELTQEESASLIAESEEMYELDMAGERKVARAEGLADGRAEGIEIGEARGEARGLESVARNALAQGLSADMVSKITGLDIETINGL